MKTRAMSFTEVLGVTALLVGTFATLGSLRPSDLSKPDAQRRTEQANAIYMLDSDSATPKDCQQAGLRGEFYCTIPSSCVGDDEPVFHDAFTISEYGWKDGQHAGCCELRVERYTYCIPVNGDGYGWAYFGLGGDETWTFVSPGSLCEKP